MSLLGFNLNKNVFEAMLETQNTKKCESKHNLFIDPIHVSRFPVAELGLFKPQTNFAFCGIHGVWSMAYVAPHLNAKVPTNSSWKWVRRISFPQHLPASFHDIEPFPHLLTETNVHNITTTSKKNHCLYLKNSAN